MPGDIFLCPIVSLSAGVVLYGQARDRLGSQRMLPYTHPKPIAIEDGVWIGIQSLILPGVRVKRGSGFSTGAVVATSGPPDGLVYWEAMVENIGRRSVHG